MTVEEAVKASGTGTALWKGSIKATQKALYPDEELLYAMTCNVSILPVRGTLPNVSDFRNKISGVLAVTQERLLFCNNVLGKGISKQLPLANIQSMNDQTSLYMGLIALRICGLTEMFVVDGNAKTISALKDAIHQTQTAISPNPPTSAGSSLVNQLRELKTLVDEGILSQEEFDAKKKQLLGL